MNAVFAKILEMSLYGSIAILVVLLFRLIFRNLPKRVLIVFWMIVAVRLLLPINFASPTSLLNVSRLFESRGEKTTIEQIQKNSDEDLNAENKAVSADSADTETNTADTESQTIIEIEEEPARLNSKQALAVHIIADIWLLVIVGLVILFTVRYLMFYSKARWKARSYDGSYFTTTIESPFVIGFIRPKIFIPEKFDEDEKEYILNHEWTHIKNKDGVIKLISYFVLCLHWFNPLVWLAFVILCADIEMRVDEETTEMFDMDMVKEYCISLVKHAYADAGGSFLQNTAFSGLGFGGMETKVRIKNLLKNKEVKKFMPVLSIIVTFTVVFFASSRSLGSSIEDYFEKLGRSPIETEQPEESEITAPTTETTPSETEAPSESTAFEQSGFTKAYIDILSKLDPNKPSIKCALIHVDYDQTPELVITDSWDCRYNGFKLTLYTYQNDQAVCVLDQVDADDAYVRFYCYEPGTNAICYYEVPDFGDADTPPYLVTQTTMTAILMDMQPNQVEYATGTPNWVIKGHEDVKQTIDRLKTWDIPQDREYEVHPEYPPLDTRNAGGTDLPTPTSTTEEPTTTEETTTTEPTESTTWRYHPSQIPVDDYTKYLGTFKMEDYNYSLNVSRIDYVNHEVEMTFFVDDGVVLFEQFRVPYDGSICYFYYHSCCDSNDNGVIDDSEYYYRKVILEFWPEGIRVAFEDCDPSEIVPELDITEKFTVCCHLSTGVMYFPLSSRVIT